MKKIKQEKEEAKTDEEIKNMEIELRKKQHLAFVKEQEEGKYELSI
jgi:hypothetical protein